MCDYSEYFEEIDGWLEEKGCVTHRGLACRLNVPVNVSKSALYQYAENGGKGVKCTILTVEKDLSAFLSFQFTTVDDFGGVEKLLGDTTDKYVYALHSIESSNHPKFAMQAQDYNQVEEATRGSSTLSAFTTNSVGLVHKSGIDANVRRSRTSSSRVVAAETRIPSTKATGSPSIKRPAPVVEKVSASEVSAKAKLASKANAFFGSNAKTKEKKPKQTKKEADTSVKEPKAQEIENKKKVMEEEWDVDSDDENSLNGTVGPDKDKIKKRRVAACAPQGSGGTHQSDIVLNDKEHLFDDSDGEDDMKKRSKKARESENTQEAVVYKKHGAMDDFIEDAALREKEKIGACAEGTKKKRKRLVEKMFADEKGYLVTEMVMEEVSDDDIDDFRPAPQATKRTDSGSNTTSAPAKKVKTTPVATKKGSTKSSAQQKSMMSYFSKK